MTLSGGAPPRGIATAAAGLRRRRTIGGRGAAAGGPSGNLLHQFYTDDALALKISPNVVLVVSIGFMTLVVLLHVMGKLYFDRREA
ncbi:hypothetical protein Nepgr_024224 [Nepenthes gracilis]|uniref:Protein transport protein Sec61 subunit beta n=1 Tax=Nepenthes gracilis TaxID=150966 RepID=A0AAD3Y097_NEPGR|nr:hypothetical protein Nepgr_024224 [Nepenthes gracilis]